MLCLIVDKISGISLRSIVHYSTDILVVKQNIAYELQKQYGPEYQPQIVVYDPDSHIIYEE